ncbi:hypothetical protein HDF16_005464 [Granulicella aggregans]|uniref:Uncharacterized protein n=1 Tax=Granulicella aggregans TaxID=474949 RepID=A0A7W7ZIY0_9BACT|nr:hypothetical protein [Granulicella aggregans]
MAQAGQSQIYEVFAPDTSIIGTPDNLEMPRSVYSRLHQNHGLPGICLIKIIDSGWLTNLKNDELERNSLISEVSPSTEFPQLLKPNFQGEHGLSFLGQNVGAIFVILSG